MMRNRGFIIKIIFFMMIAFVSAPFIADVFAVDTQAQTVKSLIAEEGTVAPETILRPKIEYKAETLRDPFQGPITKGAVGGEKIRSGGGSESKVPPLKVQGVIWGGSLSQAIINNKVVTIGDDIEGAKIIYIDRQGITVIFEGKQYRLLSPGVGDTSGEAQGGKK